MPLCRGNNSLTIVEDHNMTSTNTSDNYNGFKIEEKNGNCNNIRGIQPSENGKSSSSSSSLSSSTTTFNENKILKEDIFECLSKSNEMYRVTLTSNEILMQEIKNVDVIERYSMDDLFGCHTFRHKKTFPIHHEAYLCFFLYPKRKTGVLSNTKYREKTPLVFKIQKPIFTYQENLQVATIWKECVLSVLRATFSKWQLQKFLQTQDTNNTNLIIETTTTTRQQHGFPFNPTNVTYDDGLSNTNNELNELSLSMNGYRLLLRKFLVILNPKSGQGKTMSLFNEKVHPILTEGGIKVMLLITERPGHARSLISSADLSDIDGIATVGGDGLLYEVVNGLRCRRDSNRFVDIPLGVIAGGSGNGLARSIASYSGDSEDYKRNPVVETTLAIARGKVLPVNLSEVELDGRKIYSFLSTGWGLLADIDVESEVLRSFGEIRFYLWSFLRLAKLRVYNAQLTFTRECQDENNGNTNEQETIDGDFISVYSSCQSHIGADLVMAPNAVCNDGLIHLTYIRGNIGRIRATQFLLGLDKGDHIDMPGVTYIKVKEFTLRCDGGIKGTVTIDGERVTGEYLKVAICPKPLNVFSM